MLTRDYDIHHPMFHGPQNSAESGTGGSQGRNIQNTINLKTGSESGTCSATGGQNLLSYTGQD